MDIIRETRDRFLDIINPDNIVHTIDGYYNGAIGTVLNGDQIMFTIERTKIGVGFIIKNTCNLRRIVNNMLRESSIWDMNLDSKRGSIIFSLSDNGRIKQTVTLSKSDKLEIIGSNINLCYSININDFYDALENNHNNEKLIVNMNDNRMQVRSSSIPFDYSARSDVYDEVKVNVISSNRENDLASSNKCTRLITFDTESLIFFLNDQSCSEYVSFEITRDSSNISINIWDLNKKKLSTKRLNNVIIIESFPDCHFYLKTKDLRRIIHMNLTDSWISINDSTIILSYYIDNCEINYYFDKMLMLSEIIECAN